MISQNRQTRVYHSWKKWLRRILLLGVAITVLISCVRLVFRAWEVNSLLEKEKTELQNLEIEKADLQEKIKTATSSYELERRAREELFLQASEEAVWLKE